MKNYLIIALSVIVVILFVLRGCEKPKETVKTVRYTDTIIQIDTVINEVTKIHTKLKPTYVFIDSSRMDLSDTNEFRHTFVYNIHDSLLNATISVKETDYMPELDFKYTLKNFTINNTTTIKDSVYTKEQILTNKLYIGGSFVHNSIVNYAFLGVSFAEKNGNLFDVGVGVSLYGNITYQVGYKKLISFRKDK